MNKFQLPVTAVFLGIISGCGGNNTATNDNAAPTHEFAPSFWTQAGYSLQKDVTYVIPGTMQEVLERIEADGIDSAGAVQIQTETYDAQNRFSSTEIIARDPSVPDTQVTALRVEHTYLPDSDVLDQAAMWLWDNWHIRASGRLQQEITWTDLEFEHSIPTISYEVATRYSDDQGQPTEPQTTAMQSKLIYNDQHLLTERRFDLDGDIDNGYESFETWERDQNGRLLAVVSNDNSTLAAYELDQRGRMIQFDALQIGDSVAYRNTYHYTIVEGRKAIVIEVVYYPGSDSESTETKVMLLDEKACHSTTINRLRFSRPEDASCFSAKEW